MEVNGNAKLLPTPVLEQDDEKDLECIDMANWEYELDNWLMRGNYT